MKIRLICGFLGAGKTTLVKNILRGSESTVYLVNDFGDAGIEGEIVSHNALDIIELPSGCICCSLRAELSLALTQIYTQYTPLRLIIEPTGIATPSAVLEALQEHKLKDKFEIEPVVGVVDPKSFFNFMGDYNNFFMDQISNSDIVLINKIDLAARGEVDRVEEKIREINPSAVVYRTEYCEAVLPSAERKRELKPFLFDKDFDTLSFNSEQEFMEKPLLSLFDALASQVYGQVLRAKGVFRVDGSFIALDLASGVVSEKSLDRRGKSKFIVIGENMDKDKIIADVQKCTI